MSDPSDPNEQRHFTRIPFDASVELSQAQGEGRWHARLLDICLKGALFTRPPDWNSDIGERCGIKIRLIDAPFVITMKGRVAHITDDRVGFSCEQLDVESAAHLHRLIGLNLGSSALLERELHELLSLTPR